MKETTIGGMLMIAVGLSS